MKKRLLLIIVLFVTLVAILISTNLNNKKAIEIPPETVTELHYNKILDSLTSQILTKQQVTALNHMDCNKISNFQFRSLGSTFMDMLFGGDQFNQEITREIDKQTLDQSYIQLGKYYITCHNDWTATFPSPQTQQQYGNALNEQINNILKTQHVSSVKNLDCEKVSPTQLVRVGDARMDLMIGNEDVHAKIDKLVGERGLQVMKSTHMLEGKYALSCRN